MVQVANNAMCLPGMNGTTGRHQGRQHLHNGRNEESGRPGLRQRRNTSVNNALVELKELKPKERLPRGLECLVRCFNGNFARRKEGGPRRRLEASRGGEAGELIIASPSRPPL